MGSRTSLLLYALVRTPEMVVDRISPPFHSKLGVAFVEQSMRNSILSWSGATG